MTMNLNPQTMVQQQGGQQQYSQPNFGMAPLPGGFAPSSSSSSSRAMTSRRSST
jgi:hypothetical protein